MSISDTYRQQFADNAAEQVIDNRLSMAASQDTSRTWVDPRGYKLSDRLWDQRQATRDAIDRTLRESMAKGENALKTARELEKYLHPGIAPKRDDKGRIVPGTGSIGRNPQGGTGSYPAMRLARTEISRANGQAAIEAVRGSPFTMGVKWLLSNRHQDQDQCTQNAEQDLGFGKGVYPADFVPRYPEHPNCLCTLAPYSPDDLKTVAQRIAAELRPGWMPDRRLYSDEGVLLREGSDSYVRSERGAFGRKLDADESRPFWRTHMSASEASSYVEGTRYAGRTFKTVVQRSELRDIDQRGLDVSDGFLGPGIYGYPDQPYVSTYDMATVEYVVRAQDTLVVRDMNDFFDRMIAMGIDTAESYYSLLSEMGYDSIEHEATGTVVVLDPSIVAIVNADSIDTAGRYDRLIDVATWTFQRPGQSSEWHDREFDRFVAKVTTPELDSLNFYQDGGWKWINDGLRAGFAVSDVDATRIAQMDAAIKKQVTTEPIVVHRGVNENFISSLGLVGQASVNAVIRDPGFLSTTVDHDAALRIVKDQGDDGAMIELLIPQGASVAVLADGEVLLPRNTRVRVVDYAPIGRDGVPVYTVSVETQDLDEFGPRMAQELVDDAKADGGTTISLTTGGSITPTDGYAVGGAVTTLQVPNLSASLDADGQLFPEVRDKIDEFIHRLPTPFVGSWIDTETDIMHIDATDIIGDRDEAIRLAIERNEIAIFDFSTFEEIRTPDPKRETVDEAIARDASASDVKLAFITEPPMQTGVSDRSVASTLKTRLFDIMRSDYGVEGTEGDWDDAPDEADQTPPRALDFRPLDPSSVVVDETTGQQALPTFPTRTDIAPVVRDIIMNAVDNGITNDPGAYRDVLDYKNFNHFTTRDMVVTALHSDFKGGHDKTFYDFPNTMWSNADRERQFRAENVVGRTEVTTNSPAFMTAYSAGTVPAQVGDADMAVRNWVANEEAAGRWPVYDHYMIPAGMTAEFVEVPGQHPTVVLPAGVTFRLIGIETGLYNDALSRTWAAVGFPGQVVDNPFLSVVTPDGDFGREVQKAEQIEIDVSGYNDYAQMLIDAQVVHTDHMTADEAQALDVYIGQWYDEINLYNRTLDTADAYQLTPDQIEEVTAHMDGLIGRSKLPFDAVLYRGGSEAMFIDPSTGDALTGFDAIGAAISDPAFTSTSSSASVADGFGKPMFKIMAPKGTTALVTANHNEGEVILPRNTQFRVVNYDDSNDTYTVLVIPSDAVPSGDPGLHLDLPKATKAYQNTKLKNTQRIEADGEPNTVVDQDAIIERLGLMLYPDQTGIGKDDIIEALGSLYERLNDVNNSLENNGVYSLEAAEEGTFEIYQQAFEEAAEPAKRDFVLHIVDMGDHWSNPVRYGPIGPNTVYPTFAFMEGVADDGREAAAAQNPSDTHNRRELLVPAGTPVLAIPGFDGKTHYVLPPGGYVRKFDDRVVTGKAPADWNNDIYRVDEVAAHEITKLYEAGKTEEADALRRTFDIDVDINVKTWEYISPTLAEDLHEPAPLAFLLDQESSDGLLAFKADKAVADASGVDAMVDHWELFLDPGIDIKDASATINNGKFYHYEIAKWAINAASDVPADRLKAQADTDTEAMVRALDSLMVGMEKDHLLYSVTRSTMSGYGPEVRSKTWEPKGFVEMSLSDPDGRALPDISPLDPSRRYTAFEIMAPKGTRYAIDPADVAASGGKAVVTLGRGYFYRLIETRNVDYGDGTTGQIERWAVDGAAPAVSGGPGTPVVIPDVASAMRPVDLPRGMSYTEALSLIQSDGADLHDDDDIRSDAIKEHVEDMNLDEFQALDYYIGPGYRGINETLRDREGDTGFIDASTVPVVAGMDSLIGRHKLDDDLFVVRGATEFSLPFGLKGEAAIGASFIDHGYTSTTTKGQTASQFLDSENGAYFRIMVPKGSPALVTSNEREGEIILPRGSRYVVVGYEAEWTPTRTDKSHATVYPGPRYDMVMVADPDIAASAGPGITPPTSSPAGLSYGDPDIIRPTSPEGPAARNEINQRLADMYDSIGESETNTLQTEIALMRDRNVSLFANGKYQFGGEIGLETVDVVFSDGTAPTLQSDMMFYVPRREQAVKKTLDVVRNGEGGQVLPQAGYVDLYSNYNDAVSVEGASDSRPYRVIVPKGTPYLGLGDSGPIYLPREGALYTHEYSPFGGVDGVVAEYMTPEAVRSLQNDDSDPVLAFTMDTIQGDRDSVIESYRAWRDEHDRYAGDARSVRNAILGVDYKTGVQPTSPAWIKAGDMFTYSYSTDNYGILKQWMTGATDPGSVPKDILDAVETLTSNYLTPAPVVGAIIDAQAEQPFIVSAFGIENMNDVDAWRDAIGRQVTLADRPIGVDVGGGDRRLNPGESVAMRIMVPYHSPMMFLNNMKETGDIMLPPGMRLEVISVEPPNSTISAPTVVLGVLGGPYNTPSVYDPPGTYGPEGRALKDRFDRILNTKGTFTPSAFTTSGKKHNDDSMSSSEYDAVNGYIGPMYNGINDALRNDSELALDLGEHGVVKGLDSLIGRSKIPRDVILYRGASQDFVSRSGPDGYDAIGSVISDAGFMSTTRDADVAGGFGSINPAMFRILVPKGYPGYISANQTEGEVILPRDSRFQVVDFDPLYQVDNYTTRPLYDLLMLPNDVAIGRAGDGVDIDTGLLGDLPERIPPITDRSVLDPLVDMGRNKYYGQYDMSIFPGTNQILRQNGEFMIESLAEGQGRLEKLNMDAIDGIFSSDDVMTSGTSLVLDLLVTERDIRLVDPQKMKRGDLIHWNSYPEVSNHYVGSDPVNIRLMIPPGTPIIPDFSGGFLLPRNGRIQIVGEANNSTKNKKSYEAVYISPDRLDRAIAGQSAVVDRPSWVSDRLGSLIQAAQSPDATKARYADQIIKQRDMPWPNTERAIRFISDPDNMYVAGLEWHDSGYVTSYETSLALDRAKQIAVDNIDHSGKDFAITTTVRSDLLNLGESMVGASTATGWISSIDRGMYASVMTDPAVTILVPGDSPFVAVDGAPGEVVLPPGSLIVVGFIKNDPDMQGRDHYQAIYLPDKTTLPPPRPEPVLTTIDRQDSIARIEAAIDANTWPESSWGDGTDSADYMSDIQAVSYSLANDTLSLSIRDSEISDEVARKLREAPETANDVVVSTSFVPSDVFGASATGTDASTLIGKVGFIDGGWMIGNRDRTVGEADALTRYKNGADSDAVLDVNSFPVTILIKKGSVAVFSDSGSAILKTGTAFTVVGVETDTIDGKYGPVEIQRLLVEAVPVTGDYRQDRYFAPLAFTAAPDASATDTPPAPAFKPPTTLPDPVASLTSLHEAAQAENRTWALDRMTTQFAPRITQRAIATDTPGLDARLRDGAVRPGERTLVQSMDRAVKKPAERDLVVYRPVAPGSIPSGAQGAVLTDSAFGRGRLDNPLTRTGERVARVLVPEGMPVAADNDGQNVILPRDTSYRVLRDEPGSLDVEAIIPDMPRVRPVADPQASDFSDMGVEASNIDDAPVEARKALYEALSQAVADGIAAPTSVSWESFSEDTDGRMVALYDPKTATVRVNSNAEGFWSSPDAVVRRMHNEGWTVARTANDLILHEIAHAAQDEVYRRDGKRLTDLARDTFKGQSEFQNLVRTEVSRYAAANKAEFMAEVYVGLSQGRAYSDQINRAYEALGGLDPRVGDPIDYARYAIDAGATGLPDVRDQETIKTDDDPELPKKTDANPRKSDWKKIGVQNDRIFSSWEHGGFLESSNATERTIYNTLVDAWNAGAPLPAVSERAPADNPELGETVAYYDDTGGGGKMTVVVDNDGNMPPPELTREMHETGWAVVRTNEEAIMHELGHAAHAAKVRQLGYDSIATYMLDNPDIRYVYDSPTVTSTAESISAYATASPAEFVAEVYTLLMTDRRDMVSKEAKKLYDDLGGWDPVGDGKLKLDPDLAFALKDRMKKATVKNVPTDNDFLGIGIEPYLSISQDADAVRAKDRVINNVWNAIRDTVDLVDSPTAWLPESILVEPAEDRDNAGTIAAYNPTTGEMYISIGTKFGNDDLNGDMASDAEIKSLHSRGWVVSRSSKDVFIHELGHAAHNARVADEVGIQLHEFHKEPDFKAFHDLNSPEGTRLYIAARSVSEYATTDPLEFVAEVFTMLATGRRDELSQGVMDLYGELKGPRVRDKETGAILAFMREDEIKKATEDDPASREDFREFGVTTVLGDYPTVLDGGEPLIATMRTVNNVWNAMRQALIKTDIDGDWNVKTISYKARSDPPFGLVAYYHSNGREIVVKLHDLPVEGVEGEMEFDSDIELSNKTGWFASRNAEEIIVHEFGHAAHDAAMRGGRQVKGVERTGGLDEARKSSAWTNAEAGNDVRFNLAAAKVSEYAKTNPSEFVAEVYTLLVTGRAVDADVLDEYHSWGGPDVRSDAEVKSDIVTGVEGEPPLAFMWDPKGERDRTIERTFTVDDAPTVNDFRVVLGQFSRIEPGVDALPPRTKVQIMSALQDVVKDGGDLPKGIATVPPVGGSRMLQYNYTQDRIEIVVDQDGKPLGTDDAAKVAHDSGWLVCRDARELVLHELGHKRHNEALKAAGFKNPIEQHDLYGKDIWTPELRAAAERISGYAGTHLNELIAETYVLDMTGRGDQVPAEVRTALNRYWSGKIVGVGTKASREERAKALWTPDIVAAAKGISAFAATSPEALVAEVNSLDDAGRSRVVSSVVRRFVIEWSSSFEFGAIETTIAYLLAELADLEQRKEDHRSYTIAHERRVRAIKLRLRTLGYKGQEAAA